MQIKYRRFRLSGIRARGRGLPAEKEMLDACVAQLVRALDQQSKDPGSNPRTVNNVSFSIERFQILSNR